MSVYTKKFVMMAAVVFALTAGMVGCGSSKNKDDVPDRVEPGLLLSAGEAWVDVSYDEGKRDGFIIKAADGTFDAITDVRGYWEVYASGTLYAMNGEFSVQTGQPYYAFEKGVNEAKVATVTYTLAGDRLTLTKRDEKHGTVGQDVFVKTPVTLGSGTAKAVAAERLAKVRASK